MPISSPPQNYQLDPIGTSGTPVGPDILICDDDYHPLEVGKTGNIMVKGLPCFGRLTQSFCYSLIGNWWILLN